MYESRRRRRSRRGGGSLSPALLGGRSRRNRRGGMAHFPLSPANVGSLSAGADKYLSGNGIAGAGITSSSSQGGVMSQVLTAGYRRRRSRRDRR